MSKTPGLKLRRSTYYYRFRVPLDLEEAVGKKEIKRSLDTSDLKEAKARRDRLAVEYHDLFARLRAERAGTCMSDRRRLASLTFGEAETKIKQYVHAQNEVIDRDLGDPDIEDRDQIGFGIARSLNWYKTNNHPQLLIDIGVTKNQIFGNSLTQNTFTPNKNKYIDNLVRRALIEEKRRELAVLKGESIDRPFDQEFAAPHEDIVTLATAADEYFAEYKKTKHTVSSKRMAKVEVCLKFMKEYFGPEIDVRKISRVLCKEFRDRLNEMPSNMRKHFPDPSLTLAEIIQRGRARRLPVMKFETQQTYIRSLSALLQWAANEGYIDRNPANDMHSLAIHEPLKEKRNPFNSDELKKLFHSALFFAELSKNGNVKPSDKKPGSTEFWILIIGVLHGMRLNEICQLDVTDIQKTKSGTLYFWINNLDGKRVKNGPSKRKIPVHPHLFKLGFETYLRKRVTSGEKKLFSDIRQSVHGYSSDHFSKWFSRFLKRIGIKRAKISFHSLRHSFRDAMRTALIPENVQEAIGGWTDSKSVSKNYGSGFDVDTLAKFLSQVDYEGIDFSGMYSEEDS